MSQLTKSNSSASFKTKLINDILIKNLKDEKVTIKSTALVLTTELLRIYTKEALSRSAEQAKNQGENIVTSEHLEKVLPQLVSGL
ncbi:centromere protein X-like isoform X2 [Physella acuta]|uniref:centromere protein X-like isoform X2 n=1 Tax=Physella acuta TaxID=109671 RepID=UPI0027DC89F2|nr:centromere protein X-like isoform X2 [Physella acuta]